MLLPNTPHFPLAYYGVLALGAVAVPVHALLKAEEIEYVLTDSGAKTKEEAISVGSDRLRRASSHCFQPGSVQRKSSDCQAQS